MTNMNNNDNEDRFSNNPNKFGSFSTDGSYLFANGGKQMKCLSAKKVMWMVRVRVLHPDNTVTCVVNDCVNTVWRYMESHHFQELEPNDSLLTGPCRCTKCQHNLTLLAEQAEQAELAELAEQNQATTRSGRIYNKISNIVV